MEKIKLYGFNNLNKILIFCIYDVFYINEKKNYNKYIKYINKKYNSERLTKILKKICFSIGASILNIAHQNYIPQGASSVILFKENENYKNKKKFLINDYLMHLDKSHICIHTYPENIFKKKTNIFRIDLEISTCGVISPLKIINYIINKFKSDVLSIDYHIRGFTRNIENNKIYIDHKINSIEDFISKKILLKYKTKNINIKKVNTFITKLILKKINLKNFIFSNELKNKNSKEKKEIIKKIKKNLKEIYNMKNI
ncbi:adenosylmethionine decarboxylase [Enterobacterales bacterium endosymbiont of Anomoneura mori]|uniref:adenosylmethionine decarboxylase n=1 Tax=Enterobacterales bacterium endosymbiont of Anomoneura mori TaxID=3132096 RepID=UPI00399D2934